MAFQRCAGAASIDEVDDIDPYPLEGLYRKKDAPRLALLVSVVLFVEVCGRRGMQRLRLEI
jgi:hypothetical protein